MFGLSKIRTAAEAAMAIKDGATIGISILGLAGWPEEVARAIEKRFLETGKSRDKVVFCGSFITGGIEVAVENGKLAILQKGKVRKFVAHVDRITYSTKSKAAGGLRDRKGCFFFGAGRACPGENRSWH